MASVSIPDPSLSRYSPKNKRGYGSAKLKQIKLDVRREQWLSRGKKGCHADSNGRVDYCPSSKHISGEKNDGSSYKENRRKRREDMEGSCILANDLGSLINSAIQSSTIDHDESRDGLSSSSSSSSSRSTCFSGNVIEEEGDGSLDDWEAVADALNFDHNWRSVASKSPPECEMQYSCTIPEATQNPILDFSKQEFNTAHLVSKCQAWKPDDALRPPCLPSPNFSKRSYSPLYSDWHGNHKTVTWAWKTIISQPAQCLICYEDLDMTDANFLPCSCAFRLCIFCHKKILEVDGRCPGCRKPYDHLDGNVGFNFGANAFHILSVQGGRF